MELTISGEITQETEALFEGVGDGVTVHLNSEGGDVFSAIAIYNKLKSLKDVTVVVEGLCASAATVLACAGKCVAFENALFMFHNPMIELSAYYTSRQLGKRIEALDKILDQLTVIYGSKCRQSEELIRQMLDAETWMTSEEAKTAGFVDEIVGERATVSNRDGVTYVNKVAVHGREFKDSTGMERVKAMGAKMSNETLLTRLKSLFAGNDREKELAAENERLRAELEEARGALKTNEQIWQLIEDNLTSGSGKVKASAPPIMDAATKIVKFANRGRD